MKEYQVIGGQYNQKYYGESDSLHGAKMIAAKHDEYWDNWQGWNRPKIYRKEDCKIVDENIYHELGAAPVARFNYAIRKWIQADD